MKRAANVTICATCCLLLAGLLSLPATTPAVAQEPCFDVLTQWSRLAEVLPRVPLYTTTYTVIYPDRLAGEIDSIDAPALRKLRVGVYEGTPAADEVATRLALENVRAYPFAQDNPGQVIADILAGEIDAGLLWAPLAGQAVWELDQDYLLSVLTAGPPADPPPAFAAVAQSGDPGDCETGVSALLEGYGVVPAQQLVPVDIRDFLTMGAPNPNLDLARAGVTLYQEHCAKCHGSQAVADPDALAPVEIMESIKRFTFPGFYYIALNGRPQNGMPGFRGKLGEEELSQIYLYVRSRGHGDLEFVPELEPESGAGAGGSD